MKPWGGRFTKETDARVERFTASLPFDKRLARDDIRGSKAHCRMLVSTGIISSTEGEAILKGLDKIEEEIETGSFPFLLSLEDIHMNIEARLIQLIGHIGGKLHTARSRNDQVALDLHLYVKRETEIVMGLIKDLQQVLIKRSEEGLDVIMPGYTHLQRAQPVLLAHHLLAYFWMLERDKSRFADCLKRADQMPLGAGALAGTGFPIDREVVAKELGFSSLYENSLDAVSDRDFVVEFISDAALLMIHLSRLSEEIILWSSKEFGFVTLDDAFTTGSSIMPQKKNPDVAELARAKTGRVYGALIGILTVLKGLPLAYNKDLQEDKEGLFDTVDTIKDILSLFADMLETMTINQDKMREAVYNDYACATDLADFLVRKDIPFREAHAIVGKIVLYALENNKLLHELHEDELIRFHPALTLKNVRALLNPYNSVNARRVRGGTSASAVKKQLRMARKLLEGN
ncbi:MAG: argininosuccinate lyase [Firmicutes bacterium]|nr:argininosuccinate lyase [Bacillota bacterium]